MDDDELQSEAEIELRANPANPSVRRYDGRSLGQRVRGARTLERKLRALDRTLCEIDACLKAHIDGTKPLASGDIQALRLRYEIAEGQRNRLEGKPYVAVNPKEGKRKDPIVDARLLAIQNLIMGPPAPKLDEAAPVAEPESPKATLPESTVSMIERMRERSRVARPF